MIPIILHKITSYLDTKTALSTRILSKEWKMIVDDSPINVTYKRLIYKDDIQSAKNMKTSWIWKYSIIRKILKENKWNFNTGYFGENCCVTYEVVEEFPDFNWWDYHDDDGEGIYNNKKVYKRDTKVHDALDKIKFMEPIDSEYHQNEHFQYNSEYLENENMTWEFIKENFDKFLPSLVSSHKLVTFDIVKNNPNLGWMMIGLSENQNVTMDIVKNNQNFYDQINFIDEKWLGKLAFKGWNNYGLSRNKNISWSYVKDHLDEEWGWDGLSQNKNIRWTDIEKTFMFYEENNKKKF